MLSLLDRFIATTRSSASSSARMLIVYSLLAFLARAALGQSDEVAVRGVEA
jgi:hypothetical protein